MKVINLKNSSKNSKIRLKYIKKFEEFDKSYKNVKKASETKKISCPSWESNPAFGTLKWYRMQATLVRFPAGARIFFLFQRLLSHFLWLLTNSSNFFMYITFFFWIFWLIFQNFKKKKKSNWRGDLLTQEKFELVRGPAVLFELLSISNYLTSNLVSLDRM